MNIKFFLEGTVRWVVLLVAALVALWLGVSWMNGWFPFGASRAPQGVMDSLTAASSTPSETEILEQLTSASSTAETANSASNASVLDSLTPKNVRKK